MTAIPSATVPSATLTAADLHFRHPRQPHDALRDVDLELFPGEILALVGPNGSGKSTLLAALARDVEPRRGEVRLDGVDAWRWRRRSFACRVARLPQEPRCPDGLTVEALVASGRHPHRRWLAPPSPADRRAVAEALAWMGLEDLRSRAVTTLSGGERRRVWLAVVFAQDAPVLLLDEPAASLDLRQRWEVLALLQRLNRERGTTIAVVLHDLEEAAWLAHRVAVVQRGRLYETGSPAATITPAMLLDVYGVRAEVRNDGEGLALRVLGPGDPSRPM